MAVAPTGNIFKGLEFDGQSSKNFGVYITGEAVFNAPERDVEMISIAGRNGSFALDKGRFENIEVTYPAGIFADTETDFAEAISDFRNFLCSRKGYVRLTDEYNPDEYRMAIYKSGLDVSPTQLKAGEFNITFDCKPQRYLLSGEEPRTIDEWGTTKTVSGAIAEFNANESDGVKNFVVNIEPIQSGSDTPSPTNVRPISGHNSVVITVASPTASNTYTINLNGTRYGGTLDVISGVLTVNRAFITLDGSSDETYTDVSTSTVHSIVYTPTDTPKSYVTAAIPPYDIGNYLRSRSRSNITGNLQGFAHYSGGLRINILGLTTVDEYRAYFVNNPLQIVYELETPQTIQLTAQEIELLVGHNQIWANSGDVTVEYGSTPNTLYNPTLFKARPMLEVEGYGEIDVNGEAITLQNITFGKIPVIEAVAVNKTDTGVTLTMPVKIDTSNLNQYDWFRLEDITATVRFTNKAGYVTDNCSTATGILTTATTNTTGTLKTVKAYGQSFRYGTPQGTDVLQPSAGFIDRWTYEGVTSYHVSEINMEITYDGNDMVTVELTVEVSECFDDTTEKALSVTNSIGNSTKSALGHPTYIDLDIGEAWNSDSGTAVSLNNVVQIPAKLPTLASGANEITYDNTITDLKVIPRWWKV